jgi:hypothetical protein
MARKISQHAEFKWVARLWRGPESVKQKDVTNEGRSG